MYPQRITQLLLAACALATAAQATWLSPDRIPPRERRALISLSIPDILGPGQTAAGSSSSVDTPPTSSVPPPVTTTTTTAAPPPTTSNPPPQTSTTPITTKTSSKTTTSSTTSIEPVTETSTKVIIQTNTDGSLTSYTTATTVTSTPGLSQNGSSTSSMSPQTRNTVIGVVVGVGGAIILGALALLAWRIWGRRRAAEDGDGLTSYGGGYSGGAEKSEVGSSAGGTMTSRTPFQSTLESYHAPSHVNASSNF